MFRSEWAFLQLSLFDWGESSCIIQTKSMRSYSSLFYLKTKFDSKCQTGNVDVWSHFRSNQMGHNFKYSVCFSLQRCFWILVGHGAHRPHAKLCASWMNQRCSCRSRCGALSAVCVSAPPAGQTATAARHVRRACQLPPSCRGKTGTFTSVL